MPFFTVQVSASTGSSINTGFSMVASNLPFAYCVSIWNETGSRTAIAIANSAPTITTTDQIYCPAGGTNTKDSNNHQYVSSNGQNLYLRTAQSAIATSVVTIEFTI